MNDVLQRTRRAAKSSLTDRWELIAAADEIERLQKENERLREKNKELRTYKARLIGILVRERLAAKKDMSDALAATE